MKTPLNESVTATRANPGETLRQAREERGWSLSQVATQLNLTQQALTQLEAGAFDKLPGHTFARGYIRAYAKLMGMDQAQLVTAFDQYTGTDASGSSVHSLGRIEEPMRLSQGILRAVSFLLLLALGVAGFFWWQEHGDWSELVQDTPIEHVEVEGADGTTQIHPLDAPDSTAEQAADIQLPLGNPTPDTSAPDAAAPGVAVPEDASPDTSAATQAPASDASPATPAPTASSSTPSAPAAAASVAPSEASEEPAAESVAAGQGRLNIRFSADCWVQVTDADGKVLVSALRRAGQDLDLTAKAPLELRLGYVRGVQVRFNGEPVDVAASARGETARITLGG